MRSETESPASAAGFEAPVIVRIQHDSDGRWNVTAVGAQRPISCETLDDARRVAYLSFAHAHRCELIIRDVERHVLHRELIQARRALWPTEGPRQQLPRGRVGVWARLRRSAKKRPSSPAPVIPPS
jgi:hypothetical protein